MDAIAPAEPLPAASPPALHIPSAADLLAHIDRFLERHPKTMNPTKFGLEASGEGNLIKSLREGRQPTLAKARRIAEFIAEHDKKEAAGESAPRPFSSASPESAPPESPHRRLSREADAARSVN